MAVDVELGRGRESTFPLPVMLPLIAAVRAGCPGDWHPKLLHSALVLALLPHLEPLTPLFPSPPLSQRGGIPPPLVVLVCLYR